MGVNKKYTSFVFSYQSWDGVPRWLMATKVHIFFQTTCMNVDFSPTFFGCLPPPATGKMTRGHKKVGKKFADTILFITFAPANHDDRGIAQLV